MGRDQLVSYGGAREDYFLWAILFLSKSTFFLLMAQRNESSLIRGLVNGRAQHIMFTIGARQPTDDKG